MKLLDINVKTILDSRGQQTVHVILTTQNGAFDSSCPSGKSTGAHEVAVINPETANEKLQIIRERLLSQECDNLDQFDSLLKELDGTEDKSRIGGNLILPISMSWCRAKADEEKKELHEFLNNELSKRCEVKRQVPRPMFNVINGGAHASLKSLDFQEFQIVPTTEDFALALSVGFEYYRKLKNVLEKKFGSEKIKIGDEAGFVCPFRSNEEALDIMSELIYSQKYPLKIGLDIAATQLFSENKEGGIYTVESSMLNADELLEKYKRLIHTYPIISIEDPFFEEGFEDFAKLTINTKNDGILVITDDLTTTNQKRLEDAIQKNAGNAILIKPNQIGTILETLDVIAYAYKNGWSAVVSHRSGETMDDFIADLAVGSNAWGIKAGAPGRPERVVKYNRVLEILQ